MFLFSFLFHMMFYDFYLVITTAQFHSTKLEFRFSTGLNPACGALEICDGENP